MCTIGHCILLSAVPCLILLSFFVSIIPSFTPAIVERVPAIVLDVFTSRAPGRCSILLALPTGNNHLVYDRCSPTYSEPKNRIIEVDVCMILGTSGPDYIDIVDINCFSIYIIHAFMMNLTCLFWWGILTYNMFYAIMYIYLAASKAARGEECEVICDKVSV
jgi:hypothetical protein